MKLEMKLEMGHTLIHQSLRAVVLTYVLMGAICS